MIELDSEALDFRAASELFAPFRRLSRRDLMILGLAVNNKVPNFFPAIPVAMAIMMFRAHRKPWLEFEFQRAGNGQEKGTGRKSIAQGKASRVF